MCWGRVHAQLLDQARKARRLALRQVEDETGERGGVDDRMGERAFQAPAHQPGVEGVVAVLDKHRALSEPQERATRVPELRRSDQHRAVDVVSLARVRVDGRAAVDQRVEEGKRGIQAKSLGAHLEHEEWSVPRGLDVKGNELRVLESSLSGHLRSVNRDLLPRHQLGGAARLQVKRFGRHDRARASARRAHAISAPVTARSRSTATT